MREDGSFTFSPHPDGSSPSQSGKYSFADGLLLPSDDFCPQPGSYRVIREAATLTLELVEDDCTRRTRAVTSTAAELYSAELIAAATPQREPTATFAPTPVPLPVAESIDVPYTSQRNLDIFAPQQPGGWPVVVILHGGGISKKGVSGLGRTLAGRGAVLFAPDWHSTESTVLDEQQRPVGFEDAACAVPFARAKAPEYGGDPSHLVVVGHSAGGAAGAAITLAGDDFQGECLVEGGSALPDAFVGLDGAYKLPKYASPSRVEQNPEAWQTVNPYTYVNRGPIRNGVRFYLYAGSEQELVGDAQRLAAALQAAGYPAMFKEFPGTDHMSMATSRPDLVLAIMEAVEPGGAQQSQRSPSAGKPAPIAARNSWRRNSQ